MKADRGSRIADRGSWIADRGSRIADRGSGIGRFGNPGFKEPVFGERELGEGAGAGREAGGRSRERVVEA
ncbi:MAG: hypothetical protein WEE89_20715, partial [Gemmatimonadota bacterium]